MAMAMLLLFDKKKKRKRKMWVKEWLKMREEKGSIPILRVLKATEPQDFQLFLRLDVSSYEEILSMIKGDITKQGTNMRDPITASDRLNVTLRYLATGSSYQVTRSQTVTTIIYSS